MSDFLARSRTGSEVLENRRSHLAAALAWFQRRPKWNQGFHTLRRVGVTSGSTIWTVTCEDVTVDEVVISETGASA